MKRILVLVAAVILILLILGGATWFFLFGKKEGPLTASELAPASTSLFLWLPHVPQSLEKFKGTPVYKMWNEQAVQTALAKLTPMMDSAQDPAPATASAENSKKIRELAQSLPGYFQGEAFLAIISFQNEPKPTVEAIGGFQTGPDPASFQTFADKIKTAFPELKWQERTYPAQNYFVTEAGPDSDKVTFCVAQAKGWVFIGIGESAFQHLLDRIQAGKGDPAQLLSSQASYKNALVKQPKNFDTLTYINPAPFLAEVKKNMEKNGSKQLSSLKIYESMQGLMFTSSIEGQNFRDRWIIDMPKAKRPDYGAAELPMKGTTARFSTPDTLLYSAQNMDLGKTLAQMRDAGPNEKKVFDDGIAKVNQALAGIPLEVEKDIVPNLGPEFAIMLDWGPGKSWPDFSLALEHKDQAMVKKLVDFITGTATTASGGQVKISTGEIGGDPDYIFNIPNVPITPAIWIGKDMFLFTLNGGGLETMVKRTGSGVLDSEAYKALAAGSEIKKPASITFLDAERLLINSHGALSTVLPMAGTVVGQPDLAQSLPQVDYLRPYLGHWLLLSAMDDQGVEVEGLYEKGHPSIYALAGLSLSADFLKKIAAISTSMAAAANKPASSEPEKETGGGDIDANMVLQDLVDLDEAASTWAKEKKIAPGTPVTWTDIAPYLTENSQVATRVGLDPLGNAYVLGKTGPGQVLLAPATQQHFGATLPKNFWGKFSNDLPAPAPGDTPAP